jgi:hypothetical protein
MENLKPNDDKMNKKGPQKAVSIGQAIHHVFVALPIYRIKIISSCTKLVTSV